MAWNKGEWSELYTLFKVLSDKELMAGDSELNRITELILPVIKIIRKESNGIFEYKLSDNLVFIKKSESEIFETERKVSVSDFKKYCVLLLEKIKYSKEKTFNIPEIESFINSYESISVKAKSSDKSDIRIVVHDLRTGKKPELGFSIKSQLGSASTLFNAGKTTNFVFKIEGEGLSKENILKINSINSDKKIRDRILELYNLGFKIEFKGVLNPIFNNNLQLIDSGLPKIISSLLFIYFTSSESKIPELVNKLKIENPLNFDLSQNHPFYTYKIKRLLTDIALGMTPSKIWDGSLDATGGYLVVREDGEVICYHIYNRNEFEDYLFNNTKFDTPSSTRHNFGSIYENNGEFYFNLNLQIRFLK